MSNKVISKASVFYAATGFSGAGVFLLTCGGNLAGGVSVGVGVMLYVALGIAYLMDQA